MLILDIGIANWSTNTNIPRISRTAKYNRMQLNVENHINANDTANTLSSLDRCPHVRCLYVQMDTGLPSSAAAERLISLGGRIARAGDISNIYSHRQWSENAFTYQYATKYVYNTLIPSALWLTKRVVE